MKILLILCLWILTTVNTYTIRNDFTKTCIYSFTHPFFPAFTLPPAQPYSPGDVPLNLNNSIRFANGSSLASGQGCNSGTFFYYVPRVKQFLSTYRDINGQNVSIADVFYATNQDKLFVRTIQSNQANLDAFLYHKLLKMNLVCNNGLYGCAYFTIGDPSYSSDTIPDFDSDSPTNKSMKLYSSMTIILLICYQIFFLNIF